MPANIMQSEQYAAKKQELQKTTNQNLPKSTQTPQPHKPKIRKR